MWIEKQIENFFDCLGTFFSLGYLIAGLENWRIRTTKFNNWHQKASTNLKSRQKGMGLSSLFNKWAENSVLVESAYLHRAILKILNRQGLRVTLCLCLALSAARSSYPNR